MDENKFTKGFNDGYIIAEHKPELAEKLSIGITSKGSYENGFKAGKKEYDRERPKSNAYSTVSDP